MCRPRHGARVTSGGSCGGGRVAVVGILVPEQRVHADRGTPGVSAVLQGDDQRHHGAVSHGLHSTYRMVQIACCFVGRSANINTINNTCETGVGWGAGFLAVTPPGQVPQHKHFYCPAVPIKVVVESNHSQSNFLLCHTTQPGLHRD